MALVLTACDGPALLVVDGGVDAGFADAGHLDAGFVVDAGDIDAGFADAGFIDAGFATPTDAGPSPPVCVFDDRPVFDFQCEGDEDFCDPDPSPRVPTPETDIVATWSRVEGDFAVIDVRTRATPYKLERTFIRTCVGWRLAEDIGPSSIEDISPYEPLPWICPGFVGLGSTPPYPFPINDAYLAPNGLPIDPCWLQTSLGSPILRFHIPLAVDDVLSYQTVATRRIAGDLQPDVAVNGFQIDLLTSRGGAPDDIGPFISICDLTCDTAGGREE